MAIIFVLFLCGIFQYTISEVPDVFVHPVNRASNHLRIVNGQDASPKQFPFQVGLFITYQLKSVFCGGSLISQNYVLTAAHCLEGAISIQVVLGALNISDSSEAGRQIQTTTTYTIYPDWDATFYKNDVGVVKLSSPATLNSYVQTIAIATGSNTFANQQGTVLGWGKTYDDQQTLTSILQYVSNTILSNAECKAQSPAYDSVITDVHLCLSGQNDKGFCQGDSGGPLVSNGVQVGVVSFSYKSCQASMPSVFARVTEFADWIQDNTDIN